MTVPDAADTNISKHANQPMLSLILLSLGFGHFGSRDEAIILAGGIHTSHA